MSSITMRKVVMSLLMLAVLVFAGTSDAQAQTVDVDIVSFTFSPDPINITTGTTVRWTNQDGVPHTSTSDGAGWDSGSLSNGQQFSFTFNTPGSFPYHCTFHPSMLGTVNVTEAGPSVPSMTTYGFILLSAFLLGSSIWFINRRKQASTIA
jgi:plastocyanin